MEDLREVSQEPGFLEALGFVRRDEPTTDAVRWVWYEREFPCEEDHFDLVLQVEFELAISDSIAVSYVENRSYSFNGVFILVRNCNEHQPDGLARKRINVRTMEQLNSLVAML